MKKIIWISMLASLLVTNAWANWKEDSKGKCETNNISYEKAQQTANRLNELVKKNDKVSISKMIWYGQFKVLKTKKSGEVIHYYIETSEDFIGQYNSLFTPLVKKDLEEDHEVVCDSLGNVGTAGGRIWLDQGLKIVSIAPN